MGAKRSLLHVVHLNATPAIAHMVCMQMREEEKWVYVKQSFNTSSRKGEREGGREKMNEVGGSYASSSCRPLSPSSDDNDGGN